MDRGLLQMVSGWPEEETVEHVLEAVFDELRWTHPNLRICCGTFSSHSEVRILASRKPTDMEPIDASGATEDHVLRYRRLLEASGEVRSVDVTTDQRFAWLSPALIGEDTVSTFAIGLRAGRHTRGFVRIDAADADHLTARSIHALRNAVPTALLAVTLASACQSSHARARELLMLHGKTTQRLEEQRRQLQFVRASLIAVGRTLGGLRGTTPDAAHRAVESAIEDIVVGVSAGLAELTSHAATLEQHISPSAEEPTVRIKTTAMHVAPRGTPTGKARSSSERRG